MPGGMRDADVLIKGIVHSTTYLIHSQKVTNMNPIDLIYVTVLESRRIIYDTFCSAVSAQKGRADVVMRR